jgi:hypothetical protein
MNFGKLLAAGKSIINSGGSVAYREDKSVYLPKFESPKNPFAKTVPAANPTEAPAPATVPARRPAKMSPVSTPAPRPAAGGRPANWAASLNPLGIFRGPQGSSVRPVVRTEQTELSLDSVRVVGNDLSDADVEVVPLKSRPARAKGAAEPETEWSEVGTGYLGANLV